MVQKWLLAQVTFAVQLPAHIAAHVPPGNTFLASIISRLQSWFDLEFDSLAHEERQFKRVRTLNYTHSVSGHRDHGASPVGYCNRCDANVFFPTQSQLFPTGNTYNCKIQQPYGSDCLEAVIRNFGLGA